MLLAPGARQPEATASVVNADLTLAELAQPLAPQPRRWPLLDRQAIEEARRHGRVDLVELAYELPDLAHELRDPPPRPRPRRAVRARHSTAPAPPARRWRPASSLADWPLDARTPADHDDIAG